MSIIHRLEGEELSDIADHLLFQTLGSSDTPLIFAKNYAIDTEHDIAAGGGSSVDRKTHYIDRTLYQQIMDGEFPVANVRPVDVINAWLNHEHCEISVNAGDNAVDTYLPCHHFALRWEHRFIEFLGGKVSKYEETIWPGLVACYKREPKKIPVDLWCEPYLHDPTPRDEELLKIFKKNGVIDAAKYGKREARYGFADHQCDGTMYKCRHWSPNKLSQLNGHVAMCKLVSGVVRDTRGCDYWQERKV